VPHVVADVPGYRLDATYADTRAIRLAYLAAFPTGDAVPPD
jgi:hypothetical protein